jgi:uncharacterized protein (TIGR03083 family)
MTPLTDRTIDADSRTYQRLARLVGTLTDDDLVRPSGASEWTVAAVLSHLGSGAEITRDTLQAAQEGTDRPGDANQAVWARWNAMSPREHADGYLRAAEDLDRALGDLDAAQRDSLRVPMAFLPEPADVDLFTGMRLNEVALHAWDVEVAFDPGAVLPDDVAALLVEQYAGPLAFLLGFAGRTAELADRPVTLTVRTVSPDGTLGLELGDQARLTGPPARSDGELRLPMHALPRLLSGRLRAADDSRGIEVEGPVSLDDLRRVFAGY